MSILNFQQTIPMIQKPKLRLVRRKFHPDDLFFLCNCNHLDSGHHLAIGKCYYENCDCLEFSQAEFSLTIPIFTLDIFMFEKKDHSFYDSPQFWAEYKDWREENDTKRI